MEGKSFFFRGLLGFTQGDTVDGSEIQRTSRDGYKTLQIMG